MKGIRGSESFISLLLNELHNYKNISYFRIVTPSIKSDIKKTNKTLLIARFDGVTHYKFTLVSTYFFLKQRRFNNLPMINFKNLLKGKSIPFIDRILNRYLSRVEIKLRKTADLIVYQSVFSKKIHEFLLGHTKVDSVVIHNGVALRDNICATYDNNSTKVNAVITAHFRLGKRLKDSINICNYVNKYIPITLHIIGEIDFLTRESISGLDVSNCVFYGQITQTESFKVYKNMHVGLAPSVNEACSNSILEMMSAGLPVLVTSIGGSSEIVPNKDFVVDEGKSNDLCFIEYHNPYLSNIDIDFDQWLNKIETILSDHKRYSEIVHSHISKNFDIRDIAKKYLNAIERINKNNF